MSFEIRTLSLICALLGIADSVYLTYIRFSNDPLVCGPFAGCDVVASSPYSDLFGIPLSLYGLLFYCAAFLLVLLYKRLDASAHYFLGVTVLGALSSLYFVYVQYSKIGTYCPYCLFSAALSCMLLLLALITTWRAHSSYTETSKPVPSL